MPVGLDIDTSSRAPPAGRTSARLVLGSWQQPVIAAIGAGRHRQPPGANRRRCYRGRYADRAGCFAGCCFLPHRPLCHRRGRRDRAGDAIASVLARSRRCGAGPSGCARLRSRGGPGVWFQCVARAKARVKEALITLLTAVSAPPTAHRRGHAPRSAWISLSRRSAPQNLPEGIDRLTIHQSND